MTYRANDARQRHPTHYDISSLVSGYMAPCDVASNICQALGRGGHGRGPEGDAAGDTPAIQAVAVESEAAGGEGCGVPAGGG
jgi:hypothetical protein